MKCLLPKETLVMKISLPLGILISSRLFVKHHLLARAKLQSLVVFQGRDHADEHQTQLYCMHKTLF